MNTDGFLPSFLIRENPQNPLYPRAHHRSQEWQRG
jgi:hypothetical protein